MARWLSPLRALALGLVALGLWLIWVNRELADESRWIGFGLALIGAMGVVMRERRWLWRVHELLATVVLLMVGAEWMVRHENAVAQRAYADQLMHFVDDPVLRYQMKPGVRSDRGVTNSFGMLDVERTVAKPPGTFRVACLGDSVGGDFSLPNDNACAALERVLARQRPTEVLNFSVPGYNTLQEARALEREAPRFQPDAVVVLFVVNDPYPDLAISHHLPGHLKFEHLLFGGSCILLGRLLHRDLAPIESMLQSLFSDERSWKGVVVAGFDRIAAATAAGKLPVVVAVFPLFVDDGTRRFGRFYRQVVEEARRHGFAAVDLAQAAYAGQPLEALLKPSRDPIHPNALAHRLAAEAIAKQLGTPGGEVP